MAPGRKRLHSMVASAKRNRTHGAKSGGSGVRGDLRQKRKKGCVYVCVCVLVADAAAPHARNLTATPRERTHHVPACANGRWKGRRSPHAARRRSGPCAGVQSGRDYPHDGVAGEAPPPTPARGRPRVRPGGGLRAKSSSVAPTSGGPGQPWPAVTHHSMLYTSLPACPRATTTLPLTNLPTPYFRAACLPITCCVRRHAAATWAAAPPRTRQWRQGGRQRMRATLPP